MDNNSKYIIITPVRDEEKYIEQTIRSVISQTIKPIEWIIVDDGSQDRSTEIIYEYCREYNWIKPLRLERKSNRQPGSAVICAFNKGYEIVSNDKFDFIVKLDCDLQLMPNYFEKLFKKFQYDQRLGIASGVYLEKKHKDWIPVKMPEYHAAGASKVVRKKCFEDINGFIPIKGWDTIDEIRAQVKGWKTCHFQELKFYHLKNEGSGIGQLRTNAMHGEIYYLIGGAKAFFLIKVIHRMFYGRPFILGGLIMSVGFLKPLIQRKKLIVSNDEARYYKKLLNKRMLRKLFPLFFPNTNKEYMGT